MNKILSTKEFADWHPYVAAAPSNVDVQVKRYRATIEVLAAALQEADNCLSYRGGHEEWSESGTVAKMLEKGWLSVWIPGGFQR